MRLPTTAAMETIMYCPQTILINNRLFYVSLHTSGDFNFKNQIPLTNWLNLSRYEITIFPRTKWLVKINAQCRIARIKRRRS